MTVDISSLAMQVDTTDISRGVTQLKALAVEGGKTERAVGKQTKTMETGFRAFTATTAKLAGAYGLLLGTINSTNQFSGFDRSIREVSTLIEGTQEEITQLTEASRSLGAQFGTDATLQAKAFYQAISAGAEDATEANKLLVEANTLAIAGVTDVTTTVDVLTTVINAYGKSVDDAADISDTLFLAMRQGKTTIGELGASLGQVIPLAAPLNISIEELAGSVAALTKSGGDTARSITGLRGILASIAKPTSEAKKLSKELGLEFNAAGLEAVGFEKFLNQVIDATDGSTAKLAQLFGGVEALVPIMALAGQAGEDFADIMVMMEEKTGLTKDGLEKFANSPGFKTDKLMASLKIAAISLGDALSTVLVPAFDLASAALNKLTGVGQVVGPIQKQIELISDLESELKRLEGFRGVFGFLGPNQKAFDELEFKIESAREELERLTNVAKDGVKPVEDFGDTIDDLGDDADDAAGSIKTLADRQKDFTDSLKKELRQIGKTTAEIRKMEAADLKLGKATDELIDKIEEENKALSESESQLSRIAQITDSVMTAEERLIETQRELNELFPQGGETYERAIKQANEGLEKLVVKTESSTDRIEQFWIQMNRNIQSSLASGIFQFFDNGLKGMLASVKTTVLRIASEFASLKILQGAGFAGSGGDGKSGGGIGSSLLNFAKSGFGASSLFGSFATSGAGQSLGLSTLGPITELTGLGSGLSSAFAGLGGATVGFGIGSAIAGDKKIFGVGGSITSAIGSGLGFAIGGPLGAALGGVLGGGINALFGRGPLKQRRTELTGQLGSGGIESGGLTTHFRAKGGVFRSNKNDFVTVDALTGQITTDNNKLADFAEGLAEYANGVFEAIDSSIVTTSTALQAMGANLGVSTDGLNNFSREISLVSEKGELLTDQQISDEIAAISNELAVSLVPEIESLARNGETAFQAIGRLSDQTSVLTTAYVTLGSTFDDAREAVLGFSFEQQTALVDAAGGADLFGQKLNFIADNFLTDSRKFDIAFESLSSAMDKIGVSADITRDQYFDLLQSVDPLNESSVELFNSLLNLAPLFLQVKEAEDAIAESRRLQFEVFAEEARLISENERLRIESLESEATILRQAAQTLGFSQEASQNIVSRINSLTDFIGSVGSANNVLSASSTIFDTLFTSGQKATLEAERYNDAIENSSFSYVTSIGELANLARTVGREGGISGAQLIELADIVRNNHGEITRLLDAEVAAGSATQQLANYVSLLEESFKNLGASISAEKDSIKLALSNAIDVLVLRENDLADHRIKIQDRFQSAIESSDFAIDKVSTSIGNLSDLLGFLRESSDELTVLSRSESRAQLESAVTRARAGEFVGVDEITRAVERLSSGEISGFATREAFLSDRAKTNATLIELAGLTEGQLSFEEKNLELLESQRETIELSFNRQIEQLDEMLNSLNIEREALTNAANQQIANLDLILVEAKNQIDAINDVNTSVLTVRDAIAEFNQILGGRGTPLSQSARGPALAVNNAQRSENNEIVKELKNVCTELAEIKKQATETAEILDSVTQQGTSLRTVAA